MGRGATVLSGSVPLPADDWVLHVLPPNSGGVDRYVRDVCALRPHDCILHVSPSQLVLEMGRGEARRLLPLARPQWVEALLRGSVGRPRLMHVHSTLSPVRETVRALHALCAWPYVIGLHDIIFAEAVEQAGADEQAARFDFVRSAPEVIVPSAFLAGELDRVLGATVKRSIIANGVDLPPRLSGAPHAVVGDAVALHAAPPGPFPVAVIGALGHHKGLDFLKAVVAALPPPLRVVVFGYADGRLEPGWLIPDRAWLYGAFEPDELAALVAGLGCRVAFFPNRQPESFCYALSDAWSAGLPALVPDAGALGERVRATGAGWCYPAAATAVTAAARLQACVEGRDAGATAVTADVVSAALRGAPSRAAMVAALAAVYDRVAPGAGGATPDALALQAMPAAHLDSAFFRGELRRLSGDLQFAREQTQGLQAELASLSTQWTLRGERISELQAELGDELRKFHEQHAAHEQVIAGLSHQIEAAQSSYAAERALFLQERAAYQAERQEFIAQREALQQAVVKLERDVADTLAIAHHYERALFLIPRPLRRWLLRRTEKTNQQAGKSPEAN